MFEKLSEKLKSTDYKPLIFYVMFFLFILAMCLTAMAYDYDLWARLIVGKHVFQTGAAIKQDFLSYTPTHVWYDHEWGSGAVFYFIQHFFGSAGLVLLQAVVIFSIYFIITKTIKLRGLSTGTTPYNIIFYLFSIFAMIQVIDQPVRCQLFTFLLFTLYLYILERSRKGHNKGLIALPFLMIVWNNLHGGCVAGLGLIFMYLVGEIINRKPFKKYIWTLLASLLVLPINPWGVHYLDFLFMATTMKRTSIVEWWDIFSNSFIGAFIEFKVFASIFAAIEISYVVKAIRDKVFKFDATKYIVVFCTLFLGLQHIKHIPLAVIAMSIFFYDDIYTMFNLVTQNIFQNKKLANFKDFVVYAVIFVFAVINIKADNFKPFVEWTKFAILPVEFIKINDLKGNLLVNYGQGSFVSYKLYPHNKIYMDGRYEEVYYDFTLPVLENFLQVTPKWHELIDKYPPDIIMIEKAYPIFNFLLTRPEWKLVFQDNVYSVFVKTKDLKPKYIHPPVNLQYYRDTIFDTDINFVVQSGNEK